MDRRIRWLAAIRAVLQIFLQISALTMTRPGDVRGMHRSEINFEKSVWRIPGERMKIRRARNPQNR